MTLPSAPKTVQENYAFFDVDGTVISQDSLRTLAFSTFLKQPWRLLLLALFLPVFLVTAFSPVDRRYAKSALLWSLTVMRGRRGAIRYLTREMFETVRPFWFQEMEGVLHDLRSKGVRICYVSASGELWLRTLLNRMDPGHKTIIGSKLGFCMGGVVVRSKNCYKAEKLRRIKAHLGDKLNWMAAYSDHPADVPLLMQCQRRFVVAPRKRHLRLFKKHLGSDFTICGWSPDKE